MIELENEDFSHLTYVGTGKFGNVYHDDVSAYKRYHDYVNGPYGNTLSNPCLHFYNHRIKHLIRKRSKIKYTDLIFDTIFINGLFHGVCLKYYHGANLNVVKKTTTFDEKMDICQQLIRNAKELHHHHIYPRDFHDHNIIYTDDKNVKIIDLDDIFTKVRVFPSFFQKKKSLFSLKRAIISFFDEDNHNNIPTSLLEKIDGFEEGIKFFFRRLTSYHDIENYLQERSTTKTFLFISREQITTNTITQLLKFDDLLRVQIVVYIDLANQEDKLLFYRTSDFCLELIDKLNANGIKIFDILVNKENDENLLTTYLNNYQTIGYYFIKDDQLCYQAFNSQDKPKVYKLNA